LGNVIEYRERRKVVVKNEMSAGPHSVEPCIVIALYSGVGMVGVDENGLNLSVAEISSILVAQPLVDIDAEMV
jgi:hypothetical protein